MVVLGGLAVSYERGTPVRAFIAAGKNCFLHQSILTWYHNYEFTIDLLARL